MISKDLSIEEKELYMKVINKNSALFISNYDQIKGITVVRNHIKLKENAKPVAQKLWRLGVIQQQALLKEVQRLLKAGFIFPVENSKWASAIVLTPKKNGKW